MLVILSVNCVLFVVLEKGQAITPYYAFLTNGGGWIWMQSYFVRMKYGKPPRDSIVASNYIIR